MATKASYAEKGPWPFKGRRLIQGQYPGVLAHQPGPTAYYSMKNQIPYQENMLTAHCDNYDETMKMYASCPNLINVDKNIKKRQR